MLRLDPFLAQPLLVYLTFEPPMDYQFTLAKQGNDDALDSDVNELTGQTKSIRLERNSAGRVHMNWDAGIVRKLYERGDRTPTVR